MWKPTKKWVAGALTGVLTIAIHAVASNGWDTTEWGELLTLGVALVAAWLRENDPTPGGVPAQ